MKSTAKQPSPYKYSYIEKEKTEDDTLKAVERAMGGRITAASLSKEQQDIYHTICNWYETQSVAVPVLTLGGYAGTGKSTLVSVLADHYGEERIAFTAFTGKATSVLRRKLYEAGVSGRHDVQTLHSLMYHPIPGIDGGIHGWKKRAALDYDLLIVDEASMLDETLFNDLRSYNIPIFAVGDHGQLPPVFGNFNLMEKPMLKLEKIHRQAEDSPILALADFVRRTGQIPRIDNTHELQILPESALDAIFHSLSDTPNVDYNDVSFLSYSNRQRVELNERARRARWRNKYVESPLVGDQVINLRNTDATIFNGMRGELMRLDDTTVLHYDGDIKFAADSISVHGPICKAQFGRDKTLNDFAAVAEATGTYPHSWNDVGLLVDFGYALTFHKSQGSECEHAIVCANDIPGRVDFDTKKRALYTAFTRASKYLVVII